MKIPIKNLPEVASRIPPGGCLEYRDRNAAPAADKLSGSKECIDMVKPCSKPLKNNPFTSYRDPNTGRWVVVAAVENHCEAESILEAPAEAEIKGKVEASSSASPTVSPPPKFPSFSLLSKKSLKKYFVAVSS